MNQKTKDLVFAALCVALGLVVPQVFHLIPFVGAVPNLGGVFLPMHIPVLSSPSSPPWSPECR